MLIAASLALALTVQLAPPDRIVRQTFGAGGRTRTFYLYVPKAATPDAPAPLLLLLHGSGRDGRSLAEPWRPFAKEHGIVLVAPDALTREGWRMEEDGPAFLYALVEQIRLQYPVDERRLYVFGHSAGAIHGLAMAVMESEYFAAAAVHAGYLPDGVNAVLPEAPRRIPLGIWTGVDDPIIPVAVVRASRDRLKQHGFDATLTEIAAHGHGYYARAGEINRYAWSFLQGHRLAADPKYQEYRVGR